MVGACYCAVHNTNLGARQTRESIQFFQPWICFHCLKQVLKLKSSPSIRVNWWGWWDIILAIFPKMGKTCIKIVKIVLVLGGGGVGEGGYKLTNAIISTTFGVQIQYEKEPVEDYLGLATRSLTHFFYRYCVALAKILRCWVLSLVDVDMKMHIKIIRKKYFIFI